VLGDEDTRARYDRFGAAAAEAPFGADADIRVVTDFFDAVFGDLFGMGRKRAAGHDLRYTLELDFVEAALGCEKELRFTRTGDCARCRGTGAEGGAVGLEPCARCDGQGFVKSKAGLLGGRRDCQTCGGTGEVPKVRCGACAGTGLAESERVFTVRVPPGSQGGNNQRVAGEGSPGRRGGPAGDLHIIVRVRPDAFYRQEGEVLVCEAPISIDEAALGAEIDVPLLDVCVRMKIPAGTASGTVFRVRGKGLPQTNGGRGDAHVRVTVEVPAVLTDDARALLGKLDGALGPDAYPRRADFLARARAASGK
jgi:molecular chaperone DnaJ